MLLRSMGRSKERYGKTEISQEILFERENNILNFKCLEPEIMTSHLVDACSWMETCIEYVGKL